MTNETLAQALKIDTTADEVFYTLETYKDSVSIDYVVSYEQIIDGQEADNLGLPEDTLIWKVENPNEADYFETKEEALKCFNDMLDLYISYEISEVGGGLSDQSTSPYAWMTEGLDEPITAEAVIAHARFHLLDYRDINHDAAMYILQSWQEIYPNMASDIADAANESL